MSRVLERHKTQKTKSIKPRQSAKKPNGAASKSKTVNGASKKLPALKLEPALLRKMHDLMVKSRALEERLIKIYRVGDAFFWIGGPGEEAFGVPLGLLINKGQGLDHDWLHLHYRCTPTLVAMGMPMIDSIRLIMNRATDPSTGGRNFSNHYCYPKWNVAPVSSPIEVQYQMAIGTAWSQRRHGPNGKRPKGVSIVTGGDAGTAEGDFASCLVWASRPKAELPLYITVQNNKWGISTDYASQHGEKFIADRGKAFQMRTGVYDGNDPIESYFAIRDDLEYIKKNCKPVLSEFRVSRLYGHSSASGANLVGNEQCPIKPFEEKLLRHGVLKSVDAKKIWTDYEEEARAAAELVKSEPAPSAETIWDHVYFGGENADWRKF